MMKKLLRNFAVWLFFKTSPDVRIDVWPNGYFMIVDNKRDMIIKSILADVQTLKNVRNTIDRALNSAEEEKKTAKVIEFSKWKMH